MTEIICKSGKCYDYEQVDAQLYSVFSGRDIKSKIEFDLLKYNMWKSKCNK